MRPKWARSITIAQNLVAGTGIAIAQGVQYTAMKIANRHNLSKAKTIAERIGRGR